MEIIYDRTYRLLDEKELQLANRINELVELHFDESATVKYTAFPPHTFPLQCVISQGEYYLRYRIYMSGEVRSDGHHCTTEMLDLSKKYIVIDSEQNVNTHLLK